MILQYFFVFLHEFGTILKLFGGYNLFFKIMLQHIKSNTIQVNLVEF